MATFRKLVVFSAKGVAMNQVATGAIDTVPAGSSFHPVQVTVKIIEPPSAMGQFALTVGTNPPNFTNLAGARFTDLAIRDAANRLAQMEINQSNIPVPENTEMSYRVAAAATGGVCDISVVGFLL